MTLTEHELRQAVAALQIVKDAGRLADLRDAMAQAWRARREQHISIGTAPTLTIELAELLRIPSDDASAAVDNYLRPTPERYALGVLLRFAREVAQQQEAAAQRFAAPRPPAQRPIRSQTGRVVA